MSLLHRAAFSVADASCQQGRNVTADVRNYASRKLSAMSVRSTMHHLYPRLLALHDLNDEIALPDANGRVDLPSLMRDSHLFMESHGVYLIGESTHVVSRNVADVTYLPV